MSSPIRYLYEVLCELDSQEAVHVNLCTLPCYSSLVGDPEPRFCEWAHIQIDERTLAANLLGTVLRLSDVQKLAKKANIGQSVLDGLDPENAFRVVLREFGVREPEFAPQICDGTLSLVRLERILDQRTSGVDDPSLGGAGQSRDPVAEGRRGLERLLKVITAFLFNAGLEDVFRKVSMQQLHGYEGPPISDGESHHWLLRQEAGTLNFLLRGVARQNNEKPLLLSFLPRGREVWSEAVFQSTRSLSDSLKPEVHDTSMGLEERMRKQLRALDNFRRKLQEGQPPQIQVPQGICFFREYRDAHGLHYEGYTADGERIRCFECEDAYVLHKPYMFMAATNPSAVDFVCVALDEYFLRPV